MAEVVIAGWRRLTAADRLTVIYFLITLPIFFFLPEAGLRRAVYPLAHGVGVILIWTLRTRGFDRNPVVGWLLDLYPLALFPLLYGEVSMLNRVFYPDRFLDAAIVAWESRLFASQPARDLHLWLPWPPLAEYVHFAYFSYYAYIPLLGLVLLFTRGRSVFRNAVGTLVFTFYAGFLVFIAVPVAGPYYEFARLNPEEVGYLMPQVVHWFLDRGSSLGTAFPSSHTSVAVTVWIMAWIYSRPLAWWFFLFIPAMAAGAVYGGFHYLIDIVAGALLGILVGLLGHRWVARVNREREAAPGVAD